MASTETDTLDDQVVVTGAEGGGTLAILASKLATSPVVRLLFILAQLGLLTIIIRQFQIESAAFLRIALVAFAGFTVHHFLPKAYKLPFFATLSLGAIVLVLGIESGIILIGLGVALLTLCHLPVAFWTRVGESANLSWKLKRLQTPWFDYVGENDIKPQRKEPRWEVCYVRSRNARSRVVWVRSSW